LAYIRRHELMRAGDRVAVAVSGGADSVALLRLLLELRSELGVVLSVMHFNHKLRPEAELDQAFVAGLAEVHGLELRCEAGDVKLCAKKHQLSVEAAARRLRYEYFKRVLAQGEMNQIATAHTLDDQAETVLLRLVRGAGTRGLAGIYPAVAVGEESSIVRPLLGSARKDVLQFLKDIGQEWREDGSNRDLRFARNRVRHGVLPRLERNLNPSVREALAEAAEIARADEEYWTAEVGRILPSVWQGTSEGGVFTLGNLELLPLAVRRRVLRAGCESLGLRLQFKHVVELLRMCSHEGPKSAELPDRWMALRRKRELRIMAPLGSDGKVAAYEYILAVPGEVSVKEAGTRFQAVLVPLTGDQRYNPDHLLDRDRVGPQLKIRNWHARDRYWPGHTKALRKVKDLLQRRHVTGLERKLWPVAVSGDEVIWVRGFPTAETLRPGNGAGQAVLIQEISAKNA
jgi:tRNA(Ile)-lysidine synthase